MEHNGEECTPLVELRTTVSNGRWVIGVAGSFFGIVFSIIGWIANDNLAGIRADMKEAKGMLQSSQVEMARMRTDVDYLKAWRLEVETRVAKR